MMIISNLTTVAFIYLFYLFIFLPHCVACEILVPRPGIEPGPSAVRVQSLNHWTARKFPTVAFRQQHSMSAAPKGHC